MIGGTEEDTEELDCGEEILELEEPDGGEVVVRLDELDEPLMAFPAPIRSGIEAALSRRICFCNC